jgi:RHS repeat-associated protein
MNMEKSTKIIAAASALSFAPIFAEAQQVEYYHLDALGSVRAVTNESGDIITRHDYYPYGEEWNEPPSNDTRRFTGKERDDETGLDYFGARYYAQGPGRFVSVDPVLTASTNVAWPQRWNRYAYVSNNPLLLVDPTGEDWMDAFVYLSGFANAFGSDFVFGLGRQSYSESEFVEGQYHGDLWAAGFGSLETVSGATTTGAGVVTSPTGAGAVVAVGGVIVTAHGASVTSLATYHLSRSGPKIGSTSGRGSGKRATAKQRAEALSENEGRCVFCDEPAQQADHSIPRSRAGDTTTGPNGNLQPSCARCNQQKGAKTSQEYLQWLASKEQKE